MIVTYPIFECVSKVKPQACRCLTHHWDVPSHTTHDILLAVQIVLSTSIELHIVGDVVVSLYTKRNAHVNVCCQVNLYFEASVP